MESDTGIAVAGMACFGGSVWSDESNGAIRGDATCHTANITATAAARIASSSTVPAATSTADGASRCLAASFPKSSIISKTV